MALGEGEARREGEGRREDREDWLLAGDVEERGEIADRFGAPPPDPASQLTRSRIATTTAATSTARRTQ